MSAFTLVYTRALKVIKSDNVPIPNPTSISSGTNTSTTANKLICSTATFIKNGIAIGDVVYNITGSTSATVKSVDSETQLTLSADIFSVAGGTGKSFVVYQNSSFNGNPNYGCYLYVGAAGNVSVTTVGGDTVTFDAVPAGTILPVQILYVNSTGTATSSFIALW